jgi:UDP-GlcNAc3NAcA epimerase
LAHVEAGLRSFNMSMPEEINRILTDRISNLLFCPTPVAVANLKNEGFDKFSDSKVVLSGDIMVEGVRYYRDNKVKSNVNRNYILCTLHRAENTDNEFKLRSIIDALNTLSKEIQVIFPLHPRTRKKLTQLKIDLEFSFIEPVGYLEMIELITNSELVLTDSGGLQKEAYLLNKFCVTLREETEWVELIKNNVNTLVGSDRDLIVKKTRENLYRELDFSTELYGNGDTSKIIVESMFCFGDQ